MLAAFMLALTLLVAPWAAGTALAQDPVEYLAWDEESKQLVLRKDDGACTSYTPITDQTEWGETGQTIWYVVKEDATIGARITVLGDVHLILCDGKKLDANGGITVASGNSLTVYAQSEGNYAGRLSVELSGSDTGIGGASGGIGGALTVNGGEVKASSWSGFGIVGTLTVNGGYVSANSWSGSGIVGTLTVNGGKVYASSDSGSGIVGAGTTVTVNGGTVVTDGHVDGIGGSGATVTVNGGEVNATGHSGVGIGGGDGAAVTVNGGTVQWANGDSCGIGGVGAAVTVNGGTVESANGGSCGIGGDQGAVTLGKGVTMWAKDGGGWKDVTFDTSTRSSEMRTNTDRASVETEPTVATGEVVLGTDTALCTAGAAVGGTMRYLVSASATAPATTEGFSSAVPKASDAGLAAGTYYLYYYVDGDAKNQGSEDAGYADSGIKQATGTITLKGREATPNNADFVATGADCGKVTGLVEGEKYTIYGAGLAETEVTAGASGDYAITSGLSPGTLSVVRKGDGTATVDSDPKDITITQANFPKNLETIGASDGTSRDGKIKGTTTDMEYKPKEGGNWASASAGETSVSAGDYLVHTKALGHALASEGVQVTVANNYKALGDSTPVTILRGGEALGADAPVVGDVLTASCEASYLTLQWYRVDGGAEAPIAGANERNYTVTGDDAGKAIKVRVTQTKDDNGRDHVAGSAPTRDSAATAAVVKRTPAAIGADAARAKVTVDYPGETATPEDGYEVSLDGSKAETSPASLTALLDQSDEPKVYVRTAETDDTAAGGWVPVALTPRPDEPEGFTTASATNAATVDGKIVGTTASMEYRPREGGAWVAASATETVVRSGSYLVRAKATGSAPAGRTAEVAVGNDYVKLDTDTPVTIKRGGEALGTDAPVVGDVLAANCDASDLAWQWYRDDEPIANATGANYTVAKDDFGKRIEVVATQTRDENGDAPASPRTGNAAANGAVLKKTPAPIDADEAEQHITVAYGDEALTPGDGYEVSVDGVNAAGAPVGLTELLDGSDEPTIYVRTSETGDTAAGDWVAVHLAPRPAAPEGLTATGATGNASNGSIKGTTASMEYSADDGATWQDATDGETAGLAAGDYLVRTRATDVSPAGRAAAVTIGQRQSGGGSGHAPAPTTTEVAMLRVYNPWSGEHLYTDSMGEVHALEALGWAYEGVAWVAPASSKTPVYRLYNSNSGDHHYTTGKAEYDGLPAFGWVQEGVGWYALR